MKVLTLGPMLLSAQTAPIAPGATAGVLDVARLQNPSKTPFIVDEIRFRVERTAGNDPGGTAGTQGPALPYLLSVRLDLGPLALTSTNHIPIPLLCRALDSSVELYQPSLARYFDPFDGTIGGFVWRLPKPLYIPQGMALAPSFRFSGDFTLFDAATRLVVYVTAVGRVLPADTPYPQTVDVPVAGAWLDQVRIGAADYVAIRSVRSDLKNPYAEPLFVQRMLGAYLYQDKNLAFWVSGTQTQSTDVDRIGNDLIMARLFKSDGSMIARSATPWSHLFDWTTREMHGNCGVLFRNEFYQLQTDVRLSTMLGIVGGGGPGNSGDKVKLMASMIGYRKVAYTRSGFKEAA